MTNEIDSELIRFCKEQNDNGYDVFIVIRKRYDYCKLFKVIRNVIFGERLKIK